MPSESPPVAVLAVEDARVRAMHGEILRGAGFRVNQAEGATTGDLLVTDSAPFGGFSRTVVLADEDNTVPRDGVVAVSAHAGMQELRALYLAVREERDS